MIAEFERRIREMPTHLLQVTLDSMILAVAEAASERSRIWFEERVRSTRREFERRGVTPEPPPSPVKRMLLSAKQPRYNRQFTPEQADAIRERRARGETVKDLAREFGASRSSVSRLVNYSTYRGKCP